MNVVTLYKGWALLLAQLYYGSTILIVVPSVTQMGLALARFG